MRAEEDRLASGPWCSHLLALTSHRSPIWNWLQVVLLRDGCSQGTRSHWLYLGPCTAGTGNKCLKDQSSRLMIKLSPLSSNLTSYSLICLSIKGTWLDPHITEGSTNIWGETWRKQGFLICCWPQHKLSIYKLRLSSWLMWQRMLSPTTHSLPPLLLRNAACSKRTHGHPLKSNISQLS